MPDVLQSSLPETAASAEGAPISPTLPAHLPYVGVLAGVTAAILAGFAVVTYFVLRGEVGQGIDAATKGALIQTWNNLALLAAGFWLGSSLSGKMQGKQP